MHVQRIPQVLSCLFCKASSSWPLSWVGSPVLAPSRPSCQDEEGKMGLFLRCGRKLSVPLEWRRVFWGTSWVASRVSRNFSRLKKEGGLTLVTSQRERDSSRIERRISWFFLSCSSKYGAPSSYEEDLRDLFVFPQGSQFFMPVARGHSGLLSSPCWGPGIHLELRPETQDALPVLTWISGFLWSFHRGVRPRLVWRLASLLSSQAVKVVSDFLSSWHRDLRLSLEVPQGCHTCHLVLSRYSEWQSSPCMGIRFISSWFGHWGIFELWHDAGSLYMRFHSWQVHAEDPDSASQIKSQEVLCLSISPKTRICFIISCLSPSPVTLTGDSPRTPLSK